MNEPATILCPACGLAMIRKDASLDRGVEIDTYQCPDEECARKAVVVFEPPGGLSEEDQSWVEREIARRGAFFPSDYRPGGAGRLR